MLGLKLNHFSERGHRYRPVLLVHYGLWLLHLNFNSHSYLRSHWCAGTARNQATEVSPVAILTWFSLHIPDSVPVCLKPRSNQYQSKRWQYESYCEYYENEHTDACLQNFDYSNDWVIFWTVQGEINKLGTLSPHRSWRRSYVYVFHGLIYAQLFTSLLPACISVVLG